MTISVHKRTECSSFCVDQSFTAVNGGLKVPLLHVSVLHERT